MTAIFDPNLSQIVDIDDAVQQQIIKDADESRERWAPVARHPAFVELVKLVSNEVSRYDQELRATADTHKRFDILQRQNGAKLMFKGLESIVYEATGQQADIFQPGDIDAQVLASIEPRSEFKMMRESWMELLKSLDVQTENLNLTADQANALISRRIGLESCLSQMARTIMQGKSGPSAAPRPSSAASVAISPIPATKPTKWTIERIDQNTRNAVDFFQK